MVLSARILCESWWIEVCRKVNKSAVFIENAAAECLHWHGGLARLFKAGALSVKQYSSFENGEKEEKKAVFIVSNPVVGSVRMILRDIVTNSTFENCVLITACSPSALTLATTGNVEGTNEMNATTKLELDILHWMKNKKDFTVEVCNFPLSFISLSDYFFLLPPFQDLFPFLDSDLEGKLPEKISQKISMESLPLELQVCIVHLATTIDSLLSYLNVKEDIYYMGPLSSLIALQLQSCSSASLRSQTATTKMSIIFIDRTLDVASVTQYGSTCFFDKVKTVLPTLEGHNVDVAINMMPGYFSKEYSAEDVSLPGCLHQQGSRVIEWLLNWNQKDILLGLYKSIVSVGLAAASPTHPTVESLEKVVEDIEKKDKDAFILNTGIFQPILGVVQALKSPKLSGVEFAESIEKILLQSIAAENSTTEAIKQIENLITTRKERGLSLDTIASVLVYLYSLVGTQYSIQQKVELDLQSAFSQALLEDKDSLSSTFLNPLLPYSGEVSSKETNSLTAKCFQKLNALKGARKNTTNYRFLTKSIGRMEPLVCSDLLSCLVADLTDVRKPEIADLVYVQPDSLRSRFSMLLNTSKPHPMDNETILVFIVGGTNGRETQVMKELFGLHDKEVLIGSTSFVTPTSVLQNIFVRDPLKPYAL